MRNVHNWGDILVSRLMGRGDSVIEEWFFSVFSRSPLVGARSLSEWKLCHFMVVDPKFFDVPFDTFIINSVSELFFKNLKQFEPILEKRVMVKA
jgi:hypothetical protein